MGFKMNTTAPKGWLYSVADMTKEKVMEFDALPYPPAWLSDSWLSMMGMIPTRTQDGMDKYEFCDHLWNLKIVMREEGHVFNIDTLC